MYTEKTSTATKVRGSGGQSSCQSTPSPGDKAMASIIVSFGGLVDSHYPDLDSQCQQRDKSITLASRASVTHTGLGEEQVATCFRESALESLLMRDWAVATQKSL